MIAPSRGMASSGREYRRTSGEWFVGSGLKPSFSQIVLLNLRRTRARKNQRNQKVAAGLGGGRPPRTRSGDGEGWGRDRERDSFCSARRNDGGWDARFAKRNPQIGIGLRLAFHEAVASLGPRQDLRLLIVENEFAAIGLDREHSVTVTLFVTNDRDEQRLTRPARLHEHAALEQHIVF